MVTDVGYDILTILQNKLEALEAYAQYLKDADEVSDSSTRELLQAIRRDDEQHVERLTAELARLVQEGKFSPPAEASHRRPS